MRKMLLAVAALSVVTTACVPSVAVLQTESAGQTGCVPESIGVSNGRMVNVGYLWNASCNGKTYLCTDLSSGPKSGQVSCAVAQ